MAAVVAVVATAVESVGHAIGQAVKEVGHAVEQTVHEINKGIDSAVKATGKAFHDLDHAVTTAIPGGWATIGAVALTIATWGAAGETIPAAMASDVAITSAVEAGAMTAAEAATMTAAVEAGAMTAAEASALATASIEAGSLAAVDATAITASGTMAGSAAAGAVGSTVEAGLTDAAVDVAANTAQGLGATASEASTIGSNLSEIVSGTGSFGNIGGATVGEIGGLAPTAATPAWQSALIAAGKGALVGGTLGGTKAAITGGNILDSALKGALIGGATAGLGSGLGSAISESGLSSGLSSYLGNTAANAAVNLAQGADPTKLLTNMALSGGLGQLSSAANLAQYMDPTIANTISSAATGALGSAIKGGDIATGALSGAISGGVGTFTNSLIKAQTDLASKAEDMASIKANLATTYENLTAQQALVAERSSYLAEDKAALQDLIDANQTDTKEFQTAKAIYEEDLSQLKQDLAQNNEYQSKYDAAKTAFTDVQSKMQDAVALNSQFKTSYDTAQKNYNAAVTSYNSQHDSVVNLQNTALDLQKQVDDQQAIYDTNKAAYAANNSNTAALNAANAAADRLNILIPQLNTAAETFTTANNNLNTMFTNILQPAVTAVQTATDALDKSTVAANAMYAGDFTASKTALQEAADLLKQSTTTTNDYYNNVFTQAKSAAETAAAEASKSADAANAYFNGTYTPAQQALIDAQQLVKDTTTNMGTLSDKYATTLSAVQDSAAKFTDAVFSSNIAQNTLGNMVYDKATGTWSIDQANLNKQGTQMLADIVSGSTTPKTADEMSGMLKTTDSLGKPVYIDDNGNVYDGLTGIRNAALSSEITKAFAPVDLSKGTNLAQTNVIIYGSPADQTSTDAQTGGISTTSTNQMGSPTLDEKTLEMASRYLALSPAAKAAFDATVAKGNSPEDTMAAAEASMKQSANTFVPPDTTLMTTQDAADAISEIDNKIAAMKSANASQSEIAAMEYVRQNLVDTITGGNGSGGSGTGTSTTGTTTGTSGTGGTGGNGTSGSGGLGTMGISTTPATPTTPTTVASNTTTDTSTTTPIDTSVATSTPTDTSGTGTSSSGTSSAGTSSTGTGTKSTALTANTTGASNLLGKTSASDALVANIVGGNAKIDLGGHFSAPQMYSTTVNPYGTQQTSSEFTPVYAATGGSVSGLAALKSSTSADTSSGTNVVGDNTGSIDLGGKFSGAPIIYATNTATPKYAAGGDVDYSPVIYQGGGDINLMRKINPFHQYLHANLPQVHSRAFAEGGHVPEFYSEGGLANRYVQGDGDGTSDDVPAMLANGEFVIPADVVSSLGNGSNESGSQVLDKFLQTIREHKQKHDPKELPPDSLGPLAYLNKATKKVGK